MKINSSLSAVACMLTLSALIPSACGGDSDTKGDGGSPKGGEAGDAGEGGTDNTGGTRPTGGAGAGPTGGRGGSSGSAGRGGSSGDAGSAGEAGGGGVGASGGEAGAGGGQDGGAGGAPECPFAMDATVSGTLKITTDDNFRLYVNGVLIDETPRLWNSPQTYMVNVFRHPSRKNVLAVHGLNNAEIDGLDRGVIVDLSFDAGAGLESVLSDATWKLSTTLVASWFEVDFVDTAWVAATDEGPHGITPYGNILGTSSARWLWSYDSNVPAASKPTTEEVWVRKVFYVSAAGTVSATPSACP